MIALRQLCFATNNNHKLSEIQALVPDDLKILSLGDIGCDTDIPETAPTLEGNALIKAKYIWDQFGIDCFADDTGLEVEALDMAPGVYSARYAGPQKDNQQNMQKLLLNLQDKDNRAAQFRTVICLILQGKPQYFEGIVKGHIIEAPRGTQGFGYDPIFQPLAHQHTFAEMSADQKNHISHRGRAVKGLIDFLNAGESL